MDVLLVVAFLEIVAADTLEIDASSGTLSITMVWSEKMISGWSDLLFNLLSWEEMCVGIGIYVAYKQ